MFVFFSIMSTVVISTISSVIIASAPGLPLVSISRRLLGLPAKVLQLLEGPRAVLKGQV